MYGLIMNDNDGKSIVNWVFCWWMRYKFLWCSAVIRYSRYYFLGAARWWQSAKEIREEKEEISREQRTLKVIRCPATSPLDSTFSSDSSYARPPPGQATAVSSFSLLESRNLRFKFSMSEEVQNCSLFPPDLRYHAISGRWAPQSYNANSKLVQIFAPCVCISQLRFHTILIDRKSVV